MLPRATEEQVLDFVAEFFDALGLDYAMLRQVPVGDRRLDALIVTGDLGPSIAIEAKTSRSDFRRDTDEKRSAAWEIAEVCMYAAPAGVIHPDMLPTGWGLMETPNGNGSPALLVAGERHELVMPMDRLHATLLRRAARVEDALRQPSTPTTERVALLDQIARLEDVVARQRDTVRRERDRAQHAAEQVAAYVGGQLCSACDEPIDYTRLGWRHHDQSCEEPCRKMRQETERVRRQAVHGVAYIASYTPPVTPLALVAEEPSPEVSTGR